MQLSCKLLVTTILTVQSHVTDLWHRKRKVFDQFSKENRLDVVPWMGWAYYMHLRSGRDHFWNRLLTFSRSYEVTELSWFHNDRHWTILCMVGSEPVSLVNLSYKPAKNTTSYFRRQPKTFTPFALRRFDQWGRCPSWHINKCFLSQIFTQ